MNSQSATDQKKRKKPRSTAAETATIPNALETAAAKGGTVDARKRTTRRPRGESPARDRPMARPTKAPRITVAHAV